MTDQNDKLTPESTDAQPRKLLLGKRVLRHFNVRSSIQTGALRDSAEPTASTDDPTGGPVSASYTVTQRTR